MTANKEDKKTIDYMELFVEFNKTKESKAVYAEFGINPNDEYKLNELRQDQFFAAWEKAFGEYAKRNYIHNGSEYIAR